MSDKNFSWGILGLILGIVAPVIAIVVLAATGIADPVTISALITVTISSITGLSGVMNPNRKFDHDSEQAKLTAETNENMQTIKNMLQ